jgi:wyosine [tRNA(Phe)-imidazoG37] synthetase (radical SAM superfamily)
MSTFLFDSIIFGPVWSRRLGESLGVNLLPSGIKVCNFSCVYCECGLTPDSEQNEKFPSAGKVKDLLNEKLAKMKASGDYLDCITFAGNGEPTLHPMFPEIVNETIESRNRLFPNAKIAVLSNATLVHEKRIFDALLQVDLNILKLDSALPDTLQAINCPRGKFDLSKAIEAFRLFNGRLIIQTLFFKGICNGIQIDNTSEKEVNSWLELLEIIRPETVMIYSLARDTAMSNLKGAAADELNAIAERVRKLGIDTLVTP